MLDYAELEYRDARFHYVMMHQDPLSRGWCIFELIVRIQSAMRLAGLARPEDVVPPVLRRDPSFPRLVVVPGLSSVVDVSGVKYDRFGEMAVFAPSDKAKISRRILESWTPAAFNRTIAHLRAAAMQSYCQVREQASARG